jgi:hypothetical protein
MYTKKPTLAPAMRTLIFSIALCLLACEQTAPGSSTDTPPKPPTLNLPDQAAAVLKALMSNNYAALERHIEPGGKILFSPYAYIDTTKAIRFTGRELSEAADSKKMLTWGEFDATGEPIQLSVADYFARFIKNKNFLQPDSLLVNKSVTAGNMVNNLKQLFPDAEYVEYYCKGSDDYAGMDWGALRLIFKKKLNNYYLVAVVGDRWTS